MRSWCRRVICGVVVVVVLVLASAEWRFGSLRAARAYYRGQTLTVSIPACQLVPGQHGRIEFPLLVTSNAPTPVTILGAHVPCRCAEITGLPRQVPPLESCLLKASAPVGTAQITLYTEASQVLANVTVTPDRVSVVSP